MNGTSLDWQFSAVVTRTKRARPAQGFSLGAFPEKAAPGPIPASDSAGMTAPKRSFPLPAMRCRTFRSPLTGRFLQTLRPHERALRWRHRRPDRLWFPNRPSRTLNLLGVQKISEPAARDYASCFEEAAVYPLQDRESITCSVN